MLCPACGTAATYDQQFCRVCGMNLEVIGKLVADHSVGSAENQTRIDRTEVEKTILQRMLSWMTLGLILVGFGVALLILDKTLELPKPFETFTPFILLGGIGVAAGGLISGLRKGVEIGGKRTTSHSLRDAELKTLPTHRFNAEAPGISEQPPNLMPVESISDKRTTNEIAD